MEQNGLFSGVMGVEIPLHPQPQQIPLNNNNNPHPNNLHHPNFHHHNPPPMAAGYAPAPQLQNPVKQNPYPPFAASLNPKSPLTDDDVSDGGGGADPKKKTSPWQRMKWTDAMVRLLIMAVYYIGDEVGTESGDPGAATSSGSGKKKQSGAGLSQKKGKWKSVSRAMMEKGYYVSPQQCEDKFNDLNKRYKRVNDILGRGTACKVVENQALLDTMEHISPKMKEEVRKLLSSKHLFFREMCAYHNSCNHGPTPPVEAENSRAEAETSKIAKRVPITNDESHSHDDEDDDDSHDEYEEEEEYEDGAEGHSRGHEDECHKRVRRETGLVSSSMQEFNGELMKVVQDAVKSPWEKKQWMKMRLVRLEEERVGYQAKAFEIEKQRLKWVKFAGKKEREMERAKLENERKRIENERMALLLRQKEFDLLLSSNRRSDHPPSLCS